MAKPSQLVTALTESAVETTGLALGGAGLTCIIVVCQILAIFTSHWGELRFGQKAIATALILVVDRTLALVGDGVESAATPERDVLFVEFGLD